MVRFDFFGPVTVGGGNVVGRCIPTGNVGMDAECALISASCLWRRLRCNEVKCSRHSWAAVALALRDADRLRRLNVTGSAPFSI